MTRTNHIIYANPELTLYDSEDITPTKLSLFSIIYKFIFQALINLIYINFLFQTPN
jgi:hypothetical protein